SDSFSKAEALLIVDDGVLRKHSDRVRAVARRSVPAALPVIAVSNGASEGAQANDDLLFDVLPEAPTERQLLRALRNASYLLESERRLRESREAAEQNARELEEINAIGIALSAERDHNRLLNLILSKGREITKADAGSLFLVENIDMPIGPEDRTGNQARVQSSWLRFRLAQNDSREFSFEEEVLEITPASIAGYVAQTGETLNIKDAYQLPPDRPFTINRSFDEATGYRTCSMLVVPMRNHVGETIGVLQLINKKRDRGVRLAPAESFEQDVLPFTSLDEQLVRSLASQAAVSVENNSLYKRIEKLLDEFVYASVRAIESRDPTTEGHSWRVARMTKELARVTNRVQAGPYRDLRLTEDEIRELEYAALLHDFGKVGVREKVLVKATKLYHGELSLVRERFKTIKRTVEAGLLRRMLDRLLRRGAPPSREEIEALNAALQEEWARVDEALENVEAANQPTVTDFSDFLNRLEEIGRRTYTDVDGQERRFLVPVELLSLSIPRGTLTEAERDQIRDHVKLTY
ncbi:MAG: GAF and HD-GYP domain-containing protein, partial [Acidobacteriota bacterium]